jgi:hypothetical protein
MRSIFDLPKFAKIGLVLFFAAMAALFFFFNPEEKGLFPECVFHSMTGFYCPGCGAQRAIHHFLHLEIGGVLRNNLLFLPGMAVIFYGISLPLVNRYFGTNYPNYLYNKWVPLIMFIIIVVFGILRNIPYFPFTLLAPGN